MNIVDFPPQDKNDDVGYASQCFQAFLETAERMEEEAEGDKGEVVVAYLSKAGGLLIGGNTKDPDGLNMLLDMAKYAIMSRCFGEELDEGTPYSVH
tara:strand:- start:1360 stop:1647 length:288 start_codon:yes stop_codon:yes gene_type:complete